MGRPHPIRWGGARIIWVLVVVLASCSDEAGPVPRLDDPLIERSDRAVEIASEEWPAPWILQLATSRYRFGEADLVLDNHAYVLVTDDGSASYYLVRFHADGRVSTGPVAGRARVWFEAFDFGENAITSVDAIDVAWDRLGVRLADRCGPPQWLDVTGTRTDSGAQSWNVEYSTRGETHTVRIDARTGDVTDLVEEPC